MISKSFAVIGALVVLSAAAHAGPAPKELYGKSITLAWGETRDVVSHNETPAGIYVVLSTYVSTAGRLFTKTLHGATVHSHVTKTQVEYEGPGDRLTQSSAEFQGNSLVITNQNEGGARRIVVNFDPTFSTCQGKVMHGRERGKNTMHLTGVIGQQIELHSVSVSGVTCSVREGNAVSGS
jgi:hypothetical protein